MQCRSRSFERPSEKLRPLQALIGGRWQNAQAGKTFEVLDRATERVIANVADCQKADVDLAVAAARKAIDEGLWPKMSPTARGRILWKIGALILENLESSPSSSRSTTVW